jgi:hypothetical protein
MHELHMPAKPSTQGALPRTSAGREFTMITAAATCTVCEVQGLLKLAQYWKHRMSSWVQL